MTSGEQPIDQLLTYVRDKGLDLEIEVAATMKAAGFWVAQSVGVNRFSTPPWPPARGFDDDIQENAREVDVVAVRNAGAWSLVFAIECKPFRGSSALGVMALDHDALPSTRTGVVVAQSFRAAFPNENLQFDVASRGFKLVSVPLPKAALAPRSQAKSESSDERDPAYNALLQVLDYADNIASLSTFQNRNIVPVPLLVVDAPLFEVRLGEQSLEGQPIGAALVRVAAHKNQTHREVYVVTRNALPEWAARTCALIDDWLGRKPAP